MPYEFKTVLELGTNAGRPQLGAPQWTAKHRTWQPALDRDAHPDVWTLDRVSIGWAQQEYPGQPEPVTATFRLLAANPTALPPLQPGTLVHINTDVYPTPVSTWTQAQRDGDGPLGAIRAGHFWGRISDPVARAVVFQHRPMVEVEVTCVSHDAEFQEEYVGAEPWVNEYAWARIPHILDAAEVPYRFDWSTYVGLSPWFKDLDVDHQPLLDLLDKHLRQMSTWQLIGDIRETDPTVERGWVRLIAYPRISGGQAAAGAGAGTVVLDLVELTERADYGGTISWPNPAAQAPNQSPGGWVGPRVLVEVDRQLTTMAKDFVTWESDGHDQALHGSASVSADAASLEVVWRRDKGQTPNRVRVVDPIDDEGFWRDQLGPYAGFSDTPNAINVDQADRVLAEGPITRQEECTLHYDTDAIGMGNMFLPDEAEFEAGWGVEGVTVYVDALADEWALRALLESPPLFPDHGPATFAQGHPFGATFHVWGLREGHRLGGTSYLGGTLMGARLEVNASAPRKQRLMLGVALTRTVRRPIWQTATQVPGDAATDTASVDTVQAHHPTVTYKDNGDGVTPYLDPALTYYDLRLVRHEEGSV